VARLKVTQIRSGIGRKPNQRETLRTLGLRRINHTVVKEDRPEIRGMIFRVSHLVTVEELEDSDASRAASRAGGADQARPRRPDKSSQEVEE
jgi:large subunit ribosomal protein L30